MADNDDNNFCLLWTKTDDDSDSSRLSNTSVDGKKKTGRNNRAQQALATKKFCTKKRNQAERKTATKEKQDEPSN